MGKTGREKTRTSKTGTSKTGTSRKPVAAHPLFPAVLALWFAALLGLSCLAVRPALLDVLLFRYGLAALVGDAGAATGLPDQVVLALALSALGLLIGTTAARLMRRTAVRRQAAAPETVLHVPVLAESLEGMMEEPLFGNDQPQPVAEEPGAPKPRTPAPQVLDISAVELGSGTADEPLDLIVLAPEDPAQGPVQSARPLPLVHPLGESRLAGLAEPLVIFPGQVEEPAAVQPAPPSAEPAYGQLDREATERVLRTALANLQRLRGAA